MNTSHITNFWPGMETDLSLKAAKIVGLNVVDHVFRITKFPCLLNRNYYAEGRHFGPVYFCSPDGGSRIYSFNLFETLDDGITPHPDADASAAVIRRALTKLSIGIESANGFNISSSKKMFESDTRVQLFGLGFQTFGDHQNENIALFLAVWKMGGLP